MVSAHLTASGVSALSRIEMDIKALPDQMQKAIDGLAGEIRAGRREGSVMTTYDDDEKVVWRQSRKELISEGMRSSVIHRFKPRIKSYLRSLAEEGLLEEEQPDFEENEQDAGENQLDLGEKHTVWAIHDEAIEIVSDLSGFALGPDLDMSTQEQEVYSSYGLQATCITDDEDDSGHEDTGPSASTPPTTARSTSPGPVKRNGVGEHKHGGDLHSLDASRHVPLLQPAEGLSITATKSPGSTPAELNQRPSTPLTLPEINGSANASFNLLRYGYGQPYADDIEYPTPNGYRTQVCKPHEQRRGRRPPFTRKVDRSPSPVKDAREIRNAADSRVNSHSCRPSFSRKVTRSPCPCKDVRKSQNAVSGSDMAPDSRPFFSRQVTRRPSPIRAVRESRDVGESGEETCSGRPTFCRKAARRPSPVRVVRPGQGIRPEDINFHKWTYSVKRAGERPSISRSGSGNLVYAKARA